MSHTSLMVSSLKTSDMLNMCDFNYNKAATFFASVLETKCGAKRVSYFST
jgi:hypothetical protein